MDAVRIRPARPEEHTAVGELTVASYLADGIEPGEYVKELRDAPGRAESGLLLVAEDVHTGELAGTASLFTWEAPLRWSEGAAEGEATLRMLAVAPYARRRGIGRALTLECVRRASEVGCHHLRLLSADSMKAAHALYEQLGFVRAPVQDRSPGPGVHLLAYELSL